MPERHCRSRRLAEGAPGRTGCPRMAGVPHDPLYPAFSDAEYARRFRQVRERMDRAGVEALLLFGTASNREVHYLSNWLATSPAHLVFPREGPSSLFVQLSNHLPNARRM